MIRNISIIIIHVYQNTWSPPPLAFKSNTGNKTCDNYSELLFPMAITAQQNYHPWLVNQRLQQTQTHHSNNRRTWLCRMALLHCTAVAQSKDASPQRRSWCCVESISLHGLLVRAVSVPLVSCQLRKRYSQCTSYRLSRQTNHVPYSVLNTITIPRLVVTPGMILL